MSNFLLRQLWKGAVFAAVVLYFFSLAADAATISVTSYEGGKSLNFGDVDTVSLVSRELKIEVTSQGGTPYQVRQVIIQPLTSEKGMVLKDDILSFYTVRGSNAQGSLYRTIKEPLSFRDEIVYVSDSQGTSDSFKLVFVFEGEKITTPGDFYGKVGYILETREGESQTAVFDLKFNARLEFEVKLEILEKPFRLSTKSDKDALGYVDFHIKSSAGRKLDIYQIPEVFPCNYKGLSLPQDSLKFYLSDSLKKKGEYNTPAEIGKKELLIYTSREGSDSFRINFMIDREKLKGTETAAYKGRLIYRLKEEEEEKVIPLDMEVEVERVFDMKVTSEGLSFSNLKPNTLPQEKVVLIKVENNSQTPYRISQLISSPLTDSEGNVITEKYFSLRVELLISEEEVVSGPFAPVKTGESTIFISEDEGGDVSLRIIYRLAPSMDILAGDYATTVTYSLSEK